MVKLLEKAFTGFSTMTLNDQCGSGIVSQLPDALVLVFLEHFHEVSAQSLPGTLEGQDAAFYSLQVGMVGSRSATMGTII